MKIKHALYIILIVSFLYQISLVTNTFLKINIGKNSPFSRYSGIEQYLPIEAIAAKKLIETSGIPDFRLSKLLFEKVYEQQRIIEFAYPVKFQDQSKYIFSFKDEIHPASYKLVSTINNISLYEKE